MGQSRLFQFSIDNALEMVLIFDDTGTILYANRSAREKLEYEEGLNGSAITDVFPAEIQSVGGRPILREVADGELKSMIAYRKNRTCFAAKVKITICEEEPEELTKDAMQQKYICMAYDVSEQELLEKQVNRAGQEAEEARKVKSEFVANVTHELRTPVNGILGNTQELISSEEEKGKLKLLHLIERGCQDMNALINSILDFSKLEAGRFVLEARRFNFHTMIDYVKGNHSNRIVEKGLTFSINVSPEIPEYIIGDELRIVQILNNLLSNAYKFTSVGEIHVEIVKTAQHGNRAELFFMVMDTGIGIAKADRDKLFRSFSQVDASISRKYGGTGLGLNISKQLIELMDGSIHVDSEVGKGTTFSFHIWVEIAEEDYEKGQEFAMSPEEKGLLYKLKNLTGNPDSEKIRKYGEPENKMEIEKKMSKLILSVEMENWEKAEMFAESVKELVEEAPKEVKSAALRLKMAVQKGDYEKAVAAFEKLQENL